MYLRRKAGNPKNEPDTLVVEIERILPGGVGVAHAGERTIFVSLAAPGDLVRINIERTRGKLAFASIIEILKPSPVRVEPPCPYFGRCGGCDFQQLNYATQLKTKIDIIRDCLHRITRLDPIPNIEIHPSPQEWRYRSRANWQFDPQTRALGYFERGSHRVCDVAECAVLVPELETTLESFRNEIRAGSMEIPATDIDIVAGDDGVSVNPGFGDLNERNPVATAPGTDSYPVATAPGTDSHPVATAPGTDSHPVATAPGSDSYPVATAPGTDSYPVATAPGTDSVREVSRKIGGETYYFSAKAFFQTNHTLLESLIREAVKEACGSSAIDLYCGVGLFTLPLARRFDRVIGVESSRTSAEFARRNLENAALSNARVITAGVDEWLQSNSYSGSLDFLLLDPPRTGAEPAVIEGILALRPKQISYVSCDPATLARDLKPLLAAGYSLESVAAFDMFPQTHHVETIVRLRA